MEIRLTDTGDTRHQCFHVVDYCLKILTTVRSKSLRVQFNALTKIMKIPYDYHFPTPYIYLFNYIFHYIADI